ncbi:DUF6586 family protein [Stutzerimonas tarimensis]|uniref:DUF6586 family protein n=1 Tax=Stutzerimonas tarimensis TaxID=1507735 RepID=A0ABV7T137_9GAMM
MAQERYTRTNQKIFFAGLALDAWAASGGVPGRIQAEQEACLFHLYGAMLGLCHEVTGFYRTPQADAGTVEAILNRPVLDANPTPELAELLELAESPSSWLAGLLRHYHALFEPPRAPAKAKQDPGMAIIDAVSLDEKPTELTLEQLQAWRGELKALVLRFRESMTEW